MNDYDTEEYIYGKTPNDFLVSVADKIPSGKILLIGEGEGRNSVYLAKYGAKRGFEVIALDQSENALKKVKLLAEENGVEIQTIAADLTKFKMVPDSYDAIISIFCHLPESERENLHSNIVAALKPEGVLIMELYSKAQLMKNSGGPKSSEMLLSLEEIEKDFSSLNFILKQEVERDIFEGKLHSGLSSVLQICAFKKLN